ncbi:MAG: GAF domain-containing protein [Anaerolineae bacterium]|nr:GAF domain-containing protein [Anaerolineae bacterium]
MKNSNADLSGNTRVSSSETPEALQLFKDFVLAVGTILDLRTLASEITLRLPRLLPCDHCLVLGSNKEHTELHFVAIDRPPVEADAWDKLQDFVITTFNAEDDEIVGPWLQGQPVTTKIDDIQHPGIKWLAETLHTTTLKTLPLMFEDNLIGLIILNNPKIEATNKVDVFVQAATMALKNAQTYTETQDQSNASMHELYILRQIDRELNDNIELDYVFTMTLDWALRFTNAHAASLSLYDQEQDDLRLMHQYGHNLISEDLANMRPHRVGISYRVARSGRAEIIPDVSLDKDFVRVTNFTNSQVSLPVMREDRVIAVITVESKKINGFNDSHVEFVEKLAARAGVAIDNARLFNETERERQKLSHILNNTADIVIVNDTKDHIMLMNPSAYQLFNLHPEQNYAGQSFKDVFAKTALIDAFKRAKKSTGSLTEEIVLDNERTFNINLTHQEDIGWIIVMHDITPFKEMDRLKSELIATVSHDLKQPLSVMNGYTELLLLHNKLDEAGVGFVEMVRKSIQNMRQLIDDLLDLAKIESGIRLDLHPTRLTGLIDECIAALQPGISAKELTVTTELPADLPLVNGDSARLQQIFSNLIGNAVKYTPASGHIIVKAEQQDNSVQVDIQDDGLGISPNDQAHIFDRFYRVRRPETDSIEGTGLGLAIVKSLIEAHQGKISLESRLSEGSTFSVTLPALPEKSTEKAS